MIDTEFLAALKSDRQFFIELEKMVENGLESRVVEILARRGYQISLNDLRDTILSD